MSYPRDRELQEAARIIVSVVNERDTAEAERNRAMYELRACRTALELQRERTREWKANHDGQVLLKRRLSAKYGAIMRKKPGARWKRAKKWIKRRLPW